MRESYREDLRMLRPYVREYRPILIGVDGGADALVENGYAPDLIVGDMDSVSDEVLRCGAEVVVHAYADGHAPGLARVQDLGVPAVVFPAAGTSEDGVHPTVQGARAMGEAVLGRAGSVAVLPAGCAGAGRRCAVLPGGTSLALWTGRACCRRAARMSREISSLRR